MEASISQKNNTDSLKQCLLVAIERVTSNGFYSDHQYWPLRSSLPRLLLQNILFINILVLVRLILRPFKQPMIVSQILAGVIIGPNVLRSYKGFNSLLFSVPGEVLSHTLTHVAVIYYFFLEGLKEDVHVITLAGKKELFIAIIGTLFSFMVCGSFLLTIKGILPHNIRANGSLIYLLLSLCMSLVPSIQPILEELNLLNSELGRLSMTISMLQTTLSHALLIPYGSLLIGQNVGTIFGIYTFILNCFLYLFLFATGRPAILWIIRKIPEGGKVDSSVIITILVLALVFAGISDLMGSTIVLGPAVIATLIPAGPPLGSALIQKTNPFLRFFLLPQVFFRNGELFSLVDKEWRPEQWLILLLVFFASFGKFMGTFFTAKYYEIPNCDSVTLALIMCLKGLLELCLAANSVKTGLIDGPTFVSLELAFILVIAIVTPLVRLLARRSTLMVTAYRRGSMEESERGGELHLMMCVHDEDNVPTLLNLINIVSNIGTKPTPINLCLLHLIEFAGRGAPILSPYESTMMETLYNPKVDRITNAFEDLVNRASGRVLLSPFISISPYKTMHLDICKLAMDKKVRLTIVPLHRETISAPDDRIGQLVVKNILQEAPCSIGVLVNRRNLERPVSPIWTEIGRGYLSFRMGTIFLGGADDREALSYMSRMVENPDASLSVLRFLAPYNDADQYKKEKLLDEEFIGEFREKIEQHDNIFYKEESVANVEEMMNSIRSIGTDFDLMIVGRRQPAHSLILSALSYWSEVVELGVLGDFFASSDFVIGGASVLSIQKYRMISSSISIY